MNRTSIGISAVLGIVLGALLGSLFALTLRSTGSDDQPIAVESVGGRDGPDNERESSAEPTPEAPLGLIGGSAASPADDGAEASLEPTATPTPIGVLPGPTAVALAPTVPPPAATATPEPVPAASTPDSDTVSNIAETDQDPAADIAGDALPCTNNYVAVTMAVSDSPDELNALFDLLANNPHARAADVGASCSALSAVTDEAIYVAYVGPFANAVDACVTASNPSPEVSVVRLSDTQDEPVVSCPTISGFVTHQGQFFVADVPQGAMLTASDLDVGYGFRTKYEGSGYFVTIETSRNDVAKTGASAKQSAAGVAESVPGASELRQVMIGDTEVWYFEFADDGFSKVDLFFNLGADGYAVLGASTSSTDVAFGLASHTVASLQPIQ